MSHAEKCPVCEGKGKIKGKECHGCEGKGWITVKDRYFERDTWKLVPYNPYPYYPYPFVWEPHVWYEDKPSSPPFEITYTGSSAYTN